MAREALWRGKESDKNKTQEREALWREEEQAFAAAAASFKAREARKVSSLFLLLFLLMFRLLMFLLIFGDCSC